MSARAKAGISGDADYSDVRTLWYQEVRRFYQELIQKMHPDWDEARCVATTYQVLTLILGGWITAGHSRSVHQQRSTKELTAILLSGIERLID